MKKKNIIIIIIVITIILVIGYILFFKDINQSNNVEEIEVPDGGIDMVLKKYYEIANKVYYTGKSKANYSLSLVTKSLKDITNDEKDGNVYVRQILNFDEIVDESFTKSGKEQILNDNSLIVESGGKYYLKLYDFSTYYVNLRFNIIDITKNKIISQAIIDIAREDGNIISTNLVSDFVLEKNDEDWYIDKYTDWSNPNLSSIVENN